MSIFSFLTAEPYENRAVGRWDDDDGVRMVSTASVPDGDKPFETAFVHPEYNEGRVVIVEAYDTREDAISGHERWLAIMTQGPLPDTLIECANSHIAQIRGAGTFDRAKP